MKISDQEGTEEAFEILEMKMQDSEAELKSLKEQNKELYDENVSLK